ncbi:MAG TPA: hypothetical protein VFK61_08335 [Candidatus Limnocylindria bacterium]|nr:hypothetical protein [Candidatus Limnocylindria bacterium]
MRELRLAGGPLEAVLLPEAGARLHRLRAFGHDLLRTPDDPAEHLRDPFFWGAYVLAPWCNRAPTGPFTVGGRTLDLGSNFADGSAIHGQLYARPWTVDGDGTTCRISAGENGWPWAYEATLSARIAHGALGLELALTNRSDAPMPAGLGLHPWWRRPLRLAVEAERVYESNTEPSKARPLAGRFDLGELAEPAPSLDATWTGLRSPVVRLAWPELGVGARLEPSGAASHVVVASPPHLDAVAVEVQSHAPMGLQRLVAGKPGALTLLPPGGELKLGVALTVSRLADGQEEVAGVGEGADGAAPLYP